MKTTKIRKHHFQKFIWINFIFFKILFEIESEPAFFKASKTTLFDLFKN